MLKVRELRAGYGGVDVLHGVDLDLAEGESAAVVGANGAGKTTLVRAVCGLLAPSSGRIEVDGQDLARLPGHARVKHGIAVVLEGRNLFPELTVAENLRVAQEAGRRSGRRIFSREEILSLFPVVAERLDTPVGLMSGGQQQMVAIARALLLQPRLLLLDEPTANLDGAAREQVIGLIPTLVEQGASVVMACHDRDLINLPGVRRLKLREGRLEVR